MQRTINTESMIGKMEQEVVEELKKLGFVTRVMNRDGYGYFGTTDCRNDRYNLSIIDGNVTNLNLG